MLRSSQGPDSETRPEEWYDNNWVYWWRNRPKEWVNREWCWRLNWASILKICGYWKIQERNIMILTRLSLVWKGFMFSRHHNYCIYKRRDGQTVKEWGKEEKEGHLNSSLWKLLSYCSRAIYWPSQDALCQSGRAEWREWMEEQHNGGMEEGKEGGKKSNMNEWEWGNLFLWAHW